MSRNSRIELAGKIEAREREAREDELRELARQLKRQWRVRRAEVLDAEATGDSSASEERAT